jgi:hypothetical protein
MVGHKGEVQAAHVHSRGAGGQAAANLLPLCACHHQLQHMIGWQDMEARFLRSERAVLAAQYWERYQQESGAE